MTQLLRVRRCLSECIVSLFVLVLIPCSSQVHAQTDTSLAATQTQVDPKDNPELRRAMELFKQFKLAEAMPIFEKLAADYPSDYKIRERWAWCLFAHAATLPDAEQRRKARALGRTVAFQAKNLGDKDPILLVMLEMPEDGAEVAFSERKDVDQAMKTAEAHFAKGEFDQAREGYQRVVLIDPNNYEAALFTGDVYFKQGAYGSAGEWYSRAIQIDPDRETAYRYWADSLVAMNKSDEARSKLIDAIVAEPYNHRPWDGLNNWLKQNKLEPHHIRLHDRVALIEKVDNTVEVRLDPNLTENSASAIAWMAYGKARAAWRGDKFKKEFPNETKYRHSLKEEVDGFSQMIAALKAQPDYQSKLKELDGPLRALIILQGVGMLEPILLLDRADAGIAQDYVAYRATHRDMVREYLNGVVVPKTPKAVSQ